MVAVIHSSSSIKNALHYNENKVRQKVANFIHSANYPKDTEQLGFTDKINRLQKLILLNQQTKVNSVHISLNFDLSDHISTDALKDIADRYMEGIGFSEQPYLVYQHHDAGHPHVHIVTTNIKSDGKRISLHNLGKRYSEKVRREIEHEFKLCKAEAKQKFVYNLKPLNAQKVLYGRSDTRRAITNVLDHVLATYKYTSIAELNAILQQYNVLADQGGKDSRIYGNRGLVYRVLDENKNKVGIPIKASLIYNKPTLKNLEARFAGNDVDRQRYKRRAMNVIDFALVNKKYKSLKEFSEALQKEKISVVLRQNNNGIIYGITYVDHQTKCVFNGSHLGKQYSSNGIQQRCNIQMIDSTAQHIGILQQSPGKDLRHNNTPDSTFSGMLENLIMPEKNQYASEPSEQKQFKRKRKRRQQQMNN